MGNKWYCFRRSLGCTEGFTTFSIFCFPLGLCGFFLMLCFLLRRIGCGCDFTWFLDFIWVTTVQPSSSKLLTLHGVVPQICVGGSDISDDFLTKTHAGSKLPNWIWCSYHSRGLYRKWHEDNTCVAQRQVIEIGWLTSAVSSKFKMILPSLANFMISSFKFTQSLMMWLINPW